MPVRFFGALAATALIALPAQAPASGGGGGEGALHLVPMREMRVPIVAGQRTEGRLMFTVVLQAHDAAGAARLEAQMPALREVLLADASEFARLYASPFTPVDAQRMAHEFTTVLHHQDAAVASVLLVKVAAQS
ncbi:MAG TPA: hypothetical protein VFQ57_01590 [Sphingomonas sp.]|nr:hypothetical protein [Sphingomonas sp.]